MRDTVSHIYIKKYFQSAIWNCSEEEGEKIDWIKMGSK